MEAIAEINGYTHRLKSGNRTQRKKEETAQEISKVNQERMKPFTFSMFNIAFGEQVEFSYDGYESSGVVCTVVDDKHVEFNGEKWTLTGLAQLLSGKKLLQGTRYKCKGEWLNDIRQRLSEYCAQEDVIH